MHTATVSNETRRGVYTYPPYRGHDKRVMINYSYITNFPETSRQEILYELGLTSDEITFILSLRRREERLELNS